MAALLEVPPDHPSTTHVRAATSDDIDTIVTILARAFDTDPFFSWLVRDDELRHQGLRALFDAAVRHLTLPYDEVHVTSGAEGTALWLPPGHWQLDPADQDKYAPQFAEAFGPDKLERSFEAFEMQDQAHPREPHFYLMLLGVDPTYQNQGIGSVLLRTALRHCDARGLPAYLEASSPRNVPLYERHGFVVTDELRMPDDGPPVWKMWRTPSPTPAGG